jgi:hypothetical protein
MKVLTARQRAIIFAGVNRHLSAEPTVQARNRKPMRPNSIAPWELRLGVLRVYFDVVLEPNPAVVVLAVGVKERNRVRVGKERVEP